MIKKKFLIALSVSALILGGCVDSSTGASAKADMEAQSGNKSEVKVEAPKAEEKKAEVKVEAPKVEEKKAEAPAPVAEEKKEAPASASTTVNTTACAGCHGANFEKKAMGVSKIVKDLKKEEIIEALKGYKAGTFGGSMKAIMKAQVSALDDAKIEAIANKIGK